MWTSNTWNKTYMWSRAVSVLNSRWDASKHMSSPPSCSWIAVIYPGQSSILIEWVQAHVKYALNIKLDSLVLWKRNSVLGIIVVPPNLCQFKSSLNITEDDVEQFDTLGVLDHWCQPNCDRYAGSISLSHNWSGDRVIGYLPRQVQNGTIKALCPSNQIF